MKSSSAETACRIGYAIRTSRHSEGTQAENKRYWEKKIAEKHPHRLRSNSYLHDVRGKPCLICGLPGQAHHIQYAQPRAMALKTGDQFVVPVCRACHRKLHTQGVAEPTWWAMKGIDPVKWAERNYAKWSKEHGG